MKIRLDYVTNSSSSSFLIGRKKELSEKQKEQLLDFATTLLGEPIAETEEELKAYYTERYGLQLDAEGNAVGNGRRNEEYKKGLAAIRKGYVVYSGNVSFEGDDSIYRIYEDLFYAADDGENYTSINTSLLY